MAGVAPHPPDEIYRLLARRVQVEGGKPLTQRHGPTLLSAEAYKNDIGGPAEHAQAANGAETCACGDTRMLMIPYKVPDEDGVEHEKRYLACVNCDSVALQPRWFTGRWAPGAGA